MITQEMIDRINELARKAKSPQGLSHEETAERDFLRRAYIDAFKENLRSQLENIRFVDENETEIEELVDESAEEIAEELLPDESSDSGKIS